MSRITLAICAVFAPTVIFHACEAMATDAGSTTQVYEGAVGTAPIVMALERFSGDDAVSGHYFYRGKWFDIDLDGESKKGVVKLESRATGDKVSLKPDGAGFAGSLTTAKGKTLPVALHAVGPESAGAVPAEASEGFDLYEKLRIAGLALKPDKVETIAGRSIRWHVEPKSGLRLFRIESGYSAPAMDAMNKTLTRIQWREISDYFGCLSSEGGPGDEDSKSNTPYLSDTYVSFAWSSSWDCAGAAHPDFGTEGHSFDARSGREIALDDLLKFGKGPTSKPDSDAWLDYRSKTFAPALVALLKRFHPKQMATQKRDDDCNYADPEVWSFPAWYLTAKGLYVGASFPRVARVCDNPEWSTIPFSALNERIEPR
jgi:hypothetical protein